MCRVLSVSGTFLAQFHEKQKLFNDSVRNWILPILRKEPSKYFISESISLANISKHPINRSCQKILTILSKILSHIKAMLHLVAKHCFLRH